MSEVYSELPNIVTVTVKDYNTAAQSKFVVGKTVEEVLAMIDPATPLAGGQPKKKVTRKRRTKAEIAQEREKLLEKLPEPVADGEPLPAEKSAEKKSKNIFA